MKAKNSKYTQLKAALQGKFHEVEELREDYRRGVFALAKERLELYNTRCALEDATAKHDAARVALDKETQRVEGVYQSRLQQLRNELAQVQEQLNTAQVNAHRAMGRAAIAEDSEERAKKALRTERVWHLFTGAVLIADLLYYHVPYAKLAALLGL